MPATFEISSTRASLQIVIFIPLQSSGKSTPLNFKETFTGESSAKNEEKDVEKWIGHH